MTTYLLDADGSVGTPHEASKPSGFDSSPSRSRDIERAVTDQGVVEVVRCDDVFRVRCRPARLTELQIRTLFVTLDRDPTHPIVLRFFTDAWHDLKLRDRHALIQFLTPFIIEDVVQEPKFVSRNIARPTSPFGHLDRIAQFVAHDKEDAADLVPIFNFFFDGRWTLFEPNTETGDSIARMVGGTYPPMNLRWLANPTNQSVRAIANVAYGDWVADLHKRVLGKQETEFDEVDALVDFPHHGLVRLQYSRVTIPIQLKGGDTLILSAAASNRLIDLRKGRHVRPVQ